MEYSIEFFNQKKSKSYFSSFNTEIVGGFYKVYTNDDGIYHMAKEDEKSLKARIFFYKKYISRDKYPYLTRSYSFSKDNLSDNDHLVQILGLPEEVTYEKKNDKIKYLSVDEILSHIHFDENIKVDNTSIITNDKKILDGNDPSLIPLINYLISNGFYILNVERLNDISSLDETGLFPVYIDSELFPKDLIDEKETSHKLLMDFVSNTFLITKDAFIKYFAPLDSMSINEQATLAFDRQVDDSDEVRSEIIIALRRYFLCLAKKLVNRFYFERYQVRGISGFSILDHDFEVLDHDYRYLYQGARFDMYAKRIRHFTLENDKIKQAFSCGDYVLDTKTKPLLKIAFNTVKKYFLRHEEYAFIPSLFLKMVGLPYPSFHLFRNIDLKNIDEKSFLSRFTFIDDLDYINLGIMTTSICLDGTQLSLKDCDTKIPYYLKVVHTGNLFMSNFSGFLNLGFYKSLFGYKESKKDSFYPIYTGDTSFFNGVIDFISNSIVNAPSIKANQENTKSFILANDKNGVLIPIKRYFELLSSGLDTKEADEALKKEMNTDIITLHYLINIAFVRTYEIKADKFITKINESKIDASPITFSEHFYNPYLKYPYVSKGRNFIAYGDGEGHWYLDEKDHENFFNLFYLFHNLSIKKSDLSYLIHAFGRDIFKYVPSDDKDDANLFLTSKYFCAFFGLPYELESLIKKDANYYYLFKFEKGISMYNDERQRDLIKDDFSLAYHFVFSHALNKGVFLSGNSSTPRALHIIESQLDDDLKQYIDDVVVQGYYIENLKYNHYVDDLFIFGSKQDTKYYIKCKMFDYFESEEAEYNWIYDYNGRLLMALYHRFYDELFNENNKRYYLTSVHMNGQYIAFGRNFNCYSKTGEINSFGFTKEDKDFILKTYEKVKDEYANLPGGKRVKALFIINALGVPLVMRQKLFSNLYSHNFTLVEEEIPVFEDEIVKTDLFYLSIFETNDINSSDIFFSSNLSKLAREKGWFIYASQEIFSPEFMAPINMVKYLDETYDDIKDCQFYILDDTKDEVDEMIHPSLVNYTLELKDFIRSYSDLKGDLSSHFLFYVQEFLIYCYSKNPSFIKDYINRHIDVGSTISDKKFFHDYFAEFKLPEIEKRVKKDDIIAFISFFFIYLEQKTLLKIVNQLKRK